MSRSAPPLPDWKTHYQLLWKPMPQPIEPTERMTLAQFVAAREAIRGALAKFPEPTCHRCAEFEMGTCKLFGDVPKEFQSTPAACESWVFDEIPF